MTDPGPGRPPSERHMTGSAIKDSTARRPLTNAELAAFRALWANGQRCETCSQPLLLIQANRTTCERCSPSPWVSVTGARSVR